MSYLKRQAVPKTWPVNRKGSTYVVRPLSHLNEGLPLLIVVRDLLKVAQNRREVKKALNKKHILINGKPVREEKIGLVLFDTITLVPGKKNYRLILNNKGKFGIEEISEGESERKISKVVDKKVLKGKKIQINLRDGKNIISNIKCNTNDSIVINFKTKKAEKCIEFKESAKVFVFGGKHAGKKGIIKKIDKKHNSAEVEYDGGKFNVLIKQIIVTD